jgi:dephospho-CoA kinase
MPGQKKIKVSITGGIGSGKTVFCNALKEKGYPVIFADQIASEILENDPGVKELIITEFGEKAFVDNKPDRKYIAEKVFTDPGNVELLNAILHPPTIEKLEVIMKSELQKQNIVFVEAALIFEAGMEELFDFIVLITSDEEIKRKRKTAQGMTTEDFNRRLEHQIPDEEKSKIADFIFLNNGDKKELSKKADLLLKLIF